MVCKEVCHKDHDLEPRFGGFFWYDDPLLAHLWYDELTFSFPHAHRSDCGSARDHRCRARTPEEGREPISLPPTVKLRVFALGIGAAVSLELVLGMAAAGRGTAGTYITKNRDDRVLTASP